MSPASARTPYPYYERFRGPARLLRVARPSGSRWGHADVTTLLRRHPRMSNRRAAARRDRGRQRGRPQPHALASCSWTRRTTRGCASGRARPFTPMAHRGPARGHRGDHGGAARRMPADGTHRSISSRSSPIRCRSQRHLGRHAGASPEADEAVFHSRLGRAAIAPPRSDPSVTCASPAGRRHPSIRREAELALLPICRRPARVFRLKSPGDDLAVGVGRRRRPTADRILVGEVLSLACCCWLRAATSTDREILWG